MDIWGTNIIIDQDEGWFVGAQYCALFHIDFRKKMYELIVRLPTDELCSYEIYKCCNKIDDMLYVFPRHSNGNILVLSLRGELLHEISIDNPNKTDIDIVGTCIYKDKILAMSLGLHKFLAVDLTSNAISDVFDIYGDVHILDKNGQFILIENEVYCAIPDSNDMYKYNIEKQSFERFQIKEIKNGISSFGKAGNMWWFTSKEKGIFLWDEISDLTVWLDNFPEKFGIYRFNQDNQLFLDTSAYINPEGFFLQGAYLNGKMWFVPCWENKIFYLDIGTLAIKELVLLDENENESARIKKHKNPKFCMCYIRQERYIGVYSFKNRYIFEIDTIFFRAAIMDFSISERDVCFLNGQKIEYMIGKYGSIIETEDIGLSFYLENVHSRDKEVFSRRNVGLNIYRYTVASITL